MARSKKPNAPGLTRVGRWLGDWYSGSPIFMTFATLGFVAGAAGGVWLGWNDGTVELVLATILGGVGGVLVTILLYALMFAFAGG